MFMRSFFVKKTKKLLIFENEFHHAFSYEICAGCAIRKSQLAVFKKALKKQHIKK
jgi:hypothetical protein